VVGPSRSSGQNEAYEAGYAIGQVLVWVMMGVFCFLIVAVPISIVRGRRRRKEERERREMEERARQAWVFQQEQARAMALHAERERQLAEAARRQQVEQERQRQEEQRRQWEEESRRTREEAERQAWEREQERRRIEAETAHAAKEAKRAAERQRRDALVERFGVDDAGRIVRGEIWVGATADMIRESLGSPADKDQKVLKTKSKEIWKYHPAGTNRYKLRVTLENGVVVGWEDKT
jgi:hypothetical protein